MSYESTKNLYDVSRGRSTLASRVTSVDQRWLSADDLTRLCYWVSGEGPVDFLLCDGIGCDGFAWAYLKPYLEEHGRVFHLHMRGHGESEEPRDETRVGIDDLVADWNRVIEVEGLHRSGDSGVHERPLVALGHSMGVQVALALRDARPDLSWAGLILLCGTFEHTATNLYDTPMIERVLPLLRRAAGLGGQRLHKVWSRLLRLPLAVQVARATEMSADLTRKRDIERYLRHLGRMKPSTFLAMLEEVSRHSSRDVLPEINTPALVIGGEKDHFTPPRLSVELAELLPHAELEILVGGTHSAPIEQTIEINQRVRHFLKAHVDCF